MAREEAIRAITRVFRQIMISNATITSALQLPVAFPEFKKKILRGHMDGSTVAKELVGKFLTPAPSEQDFEKLAVQLANQATLNAETVLAAAVVVLAHSNADDVFTSVCQIAIDLDPEGWISEVNKDVKVTIGELRTKTVREIYVDALKHFSDRIGSKSIVSRSDLLFKHVPIRLHNHILPDEDAYYKREKLKEADDLRHAIVHGGNLPIIPISKSESIAKFLDEAASTAGRSVVFHFGLPMDVASLKEILGVKD